MELFEIILFNFENLLILSDKKAFLMYCEIIDEMTKLICRIVIQQQYFY